MSKRSMYRRSRCHVFICNGGNYGCLATSDPHLALEGFHPTMDSVYYK